MAFLIGGANSAADTGYDIDNSLRLNDGDTPTLTNTFGTPTSARIGTFSCWLKTSGVGVSGQGIFTNESGGNQFVIMLDDRDFRVFDYQNSAYGIHLLTDRKLRDPSAWYHLVVIFDTTDGTEGDRCKVYINGVRETSFSAEIYPDQNYDMYVNTASTVHRIGHRTGAGVKDLDGYISEVYWIDGTAKAAGDFGETDEDSGIWKPKEYTGAYGDNGFFLEFKQSGTGTDASGLGADTSGNTRHFAVANLAATDQTTDTPTNNFATFNPLMTFEDIVSGSDSTLLWSEGNTTVTGEETSGTNYTPSVSSIGVSNGKWYYDFYSPATDSGTKLGGVMDYDFSADGQKEYNDAFYGIIASNGTFYYNGSNNDSLTNATEWKDSGDILSVALNLDDMEISFSTNGASYTAAQSITGNAATSGTLHPVVYQADNEITTVNFGNPNWALSSGVADANGYGNFEYAPPSGYFALCTKNLAEYG